jgi:hypothetical protein
MGEDRAAQGRRLEDPLGRPRAEEARVLVTGLDQSGPQRADQLQEQLLRLGALQSLAEELGVEADLQRLAGERHGQRLARLADVRGLRRNVERALREAQPQRRVLLRQQADAAHHLEQLVATHAQLVLIRLRQQLLVVGEAALDQARRQHDVVDGEDDLVLQRGYANRLARAGTGDAA